MNKKLFLSLLACTTVLSGCSGDSETESKADSSIEAGADSTTTNSVEGATKTTTEASTTSNQTIAYEEPEICPGLRVKEITGTINSDIDFAENFEYNSTGHLTKLESTYGNEKKTIIYTYDDQDRPICEEKIQYIDGDVTQKVESNITYLTNSDYTYKVDIIEDDFLVASRAVKYENGLLCRETNYDSDGNVIDDLVREWLPSDNLPTHIFYTYLGYEDDYLYYETKTNSEGDIISQQGFITDDNGRIAKFVQTINNDPSDVYEEIYEYDDENRIIGMTSNGAKQEIEYSENGYNVYIVEGDNKKLSKEVTISDDGTRFTTYITGSKSKFISQYNKNNLLVSYKSYYESDTVSTADFYTYDNDGHLIKLVQKSHSGDEEYDYITIYDETGNKSLVQELSQKGSDSKNIMLTLLTTNNVYENDIFESIFTYDASDIEFYESGLLKSYTDHNLDETSQFFISYEKIY